MIYTLIGIILFFIVLMWDVYSDTKKIKIKHTKEAWIRALFLIPSFFLLVIPFANIKWYMILLKSIVTILMIQAWWWEFFDGWLNKRRGHSWRFNGSDDKDDAKSDNILQKMSPLKQALLKWGFIILFTTIYILIR